MEERLTQLEIKLAYQEQMIEDLNQVIMKQQKQIDELEQRWEDENLGEGNLLLKDLAQEVPPPHY